MQDQPAPTHDDVYFLGGHDLEMVTIAQLLRQHAAPFFDAQLTWGAKASSYAQQIHDQARQHRTLVFVELEIDLELPAQAVTELIDHHGSQAGKDRPTAIEQVAARLGISPGEFQQQRWWMLVAANDRGYVQGMRDLDPPASDEEIRDVRQQDLAAQGVTSEELADARRFAAAAELRSRGRLCVVHCGGDRTGLVAEVMEPALGGAGYDNLLVIGSTTAGFYGRGHIVTRLAAASPAAPDAWFGGALPDYGFWGAELDALSFDPVALVEEVLSAETTP